MCRGRPNLQFDTWSRTLAGHCSRSVCGSGNSLACSAALATALAALMAPCTVQPLAWHLRCARMAFLAVMPAASVEVKQKLHACCRVQAPGKSCRGTMAQLHSAHRHVQCTSMISWHASCMSTHIVPLRDPWQILGHAHNGHNVVVQGSALLEQRGGGLRGQLVENGVHACLVARLGAAERPDLGHVLLWHRQRGPLCESKCGRPTVRWSTSRTQCHADGDAFRYGSHASVTALLAAHAVKEDTQHIVWGLAAAAGCCAHHAALACRVTGGGCGTHAFLLSAGMRLSTSAKACSVGVGRGLPACHITPYRSCWLTPATDRHSAGPHAHYLLKPGACGSGSNRGLHGSA